MFFHPVTVVPVTCFPAVVVMLFQWLFSSFIGYSNDFWMLFQSLFFHLMDGVPVAWFPSSVCVSFIGVVPVTCFPTGGCCFSDCFIHWMLIQWRFPPGGCCISKGYAPTHCFLSKWLLGAIIVRRGGRGKGRDGGGSKESTGRFDESTGARAVYIGIPWCIIKSRYEKR